MNKSDKKRCIGVDLDATLAFYESGDLDKFDPTHIGEPISKMVEEVKAEIAKGTQVFLFTARANPASDDWQDHLDAMLFIPVWIEWSKKNLGTVLPVAHRKLRIFDEIWDDRGRQVLTNTGVFVTELMEAMQ